MPLIYMLARMSEIPNGGYIVPKGRHIMGKMNLLKANWSGKVGQTVGAKWKNISTIRSFTKPSNPNTAAQQTVRTGFKEISAFVALFADQIKSYSALNTKGQSVRNAIIQLNKVMVASGALVEASLEVSRGGLPSPGTIAVTSPAGLASIGATWTPVAGATISAKARIIVIAVDPVHNFAAVGTALNSAGTLSIAATVPASAVLHTYAYLIDYRGSSRVGSVSVYNLVNSPAS